MEVEESVCDVYLSDVQRFEKLTYYRVQVGVYGVVFYFFVGFVGLANKSNHRMLDVYLLDIQFVFGEKRLQSDVFDYKAVG